MCGYLVFLNFSRFKLGRSKTHIFRSQWPRGLRRRSTAARLLRLWISNSTGGMDVYLLWVFCIVKYRSVWRADHSSRGVLQTVAHRCVWSRNLEHEEAKTRYQAVKIQPQWVVTPGKQTNKQVLLINFFVR